MSNTLLIGAAILLGGLIALFLLLSKSIYFYLPPPPPPALALPPRPAPVLLGASAPQAVLAGGNFTARFVAYVKDVEERIEIILDRLSPKSESHLGIKHCRWRIGTKVRVILYGDHLTVAPAVDEFTWAGDYSIVDFDVAVSPQASGTAVLKFDVSIGDIVIARLRVDLEVTRAAVESNRRVVRSEAASSVFASYASEDRLRVLDRLSEVRRSGVDVFVDCLSLHPGDQWKPVLEIEIMKRDLFLLFWSIHAKESPWVTWEWRTALRHKGLSAIEPHPLDPVFQAAPPEELKTLHFGDPYMLARKAYENHLHNTG